MNLGLGLNIAKTKSGGGLFTLFDTTATPIVGYSLRPLNIKSYGKPVVKVRRSSDNTEKDFKSFEITNGALESWIHSANESPANYGSGAAAAYSLRYVSDSYTGSVVRVRRSIDNTEQDFTPSEITDGTLLAWVGTTASDHGYVTTWYDQSVNSNDATQSTAASQPKIVDAGVLVEENGKPALNFDGVNDGLTFDSSVFDIGNLSSFAVGKYNVLGTTILFAISGTTSDKRWYAPFASNTDFRFGYADSATALSVTGNTNRHLFTMIAGSTLGNMEAWIDNSSIGTDTLSSGIDPINGIGNFDGGFFADCNVQEIIIYDSDQSSNRTAIEANINKYYGIYTPTVNGFVSRWYDQFGSNNAEQTSASAQPKIWDASIGLVTENEKPAIDFDGVNDFLTSQQIVLIDDITMIAIASQKSYNIGFVFGQGNGFTSVDSTQQQATIGFSTSTIQFELKPDNFNEISGGISYIPNDRYLIIGNYSRGNHFYFYTNGLISNFIDNVPDSPIENYQTPLAIGRSVSRNNFTLDGTIQELFLYTNNQINNIALLQNNLNQYYIIFGPLRYNQRVTEDSGTFALTDRYEAVYDEVTEIATPSLLCTCDAYKDSSLITYGTLYNIIPA